MIVRQIVDKLDLKVVAGERGLDSTISGGYSADLLSCVMARAKQGNVWLTLQAHPNVIAVASLLELAAVIVTEDAAVPSDVVERANSEGIPVLCTPHTTYWMGGELARLGIPAQE